MEIHHMVGVQGNTSYGRCPGKYMWQDIFGVRACVHMSTVSCLCVFSVQMGGWYFCCLDPCRAMSTCKHYLL